MSERRSFFRIDESIALECKAIDVSTTNFSQPEAFFNNTNSLKLHAELKKIDNENAPLLYEIKGLSRPLAEYLYNQNRKIELISQELMAEHKPPPPSNTIRQVNLSEYGIAFGSTVALTTGQFVALRMIFLPSNTGVILFAKIIRCTPTNNGEFKIAARFYHINKTQQQLIGQQIMRAQMMEKRNKQQDES